jgi:hypothetical protein
VALIGPFYKHFKRTMKTFIKSSLTNHQTRGSAGVCLVQCDGYLLPRSKTATTIWLGVDLMQRKFSYGEDGTDRLINKFQSNI